MTVLVVLVKIKNAEKASMNNIDVEPRLTLIEILSDFRRKILIAGRLNEKVPRPVFTGRGSTLLRTGSLAE